MSNNHQARIISNMFRYAYWHFLDEEIAAQIVVSTLRIWSDNTCLTAVTINQQKKIELLKCLQQECEKKGVERRLILTLQILFKNLTKRFNNRKEKKYSVLRATLKQFSVTDRAIFVLLYLWNLSFEEVAEILRIPLDRVEKSINSHIPKLQNAI